MEKINFVNNSTPAINDTNLNKLQDNVEDAIQEVQDDVDTKLNADSVKTTQTNSDTDTYSCNYINGIIESGSNANGNYVKYADGTMICTMSVGISDASVNNAWGSWFYYYDNNTYSFAETFISVPTIQKTFVATSAAGAVLGDYGSSTVTANGFSGITIVRPTSSVVTGYVHITAIGRWK